MSVVDIYTVLNNIYTRIKIQRGYWRIRLYRQNDARVSSLTKVPNSDSWINQLLLKDHTSEIDFKRSSRIYIQ